MMCAFYAASLACFDRRLRAGGKIHWRIWVRSRVDRQAWSAREEGQTTVGAVVSVQACLQIVKCTDWIPDVLDQADHFQLAIFLNYKRLFWLNYCCARPLILLCRSSGSWSVAGVIVAHESSHSGFLNKLMWLGFCTWAPIRNAVAPNGTSMKQVKWWRKNPSSSSWNN